MAHFASASLSGLMIPVNAWDASRLSLLPRSAAATGRTKKSGPVLQRRPTGWKVISVLDTAYHPNIEADDVDDYNETYIINSELWSMIRDHKEMRAKYRFKSQQPAPMDESA